MNRIEQMREKISSLEEKNERMRDSITKALSTLRGAIKLDDLVDKEIRPSDVSQAIHELQVALDGGGDEYE